MQSLPEQQEYWPAIIATDVLLSGFSSESTLGAALIPNSSSFLQRDKTIKCVPKTTSGDESIKVGENEGEEKEDEDGDELEWEEVDDTLPTRISSWWMRFLYAIGLRPAPYANQQALRYDHELEDKDLVVEKEFTWWTKFYNSMYWTAAEMSHENKHRLVIFPEELEKQAQFGYLQVGFYKQKFTFHSRNLIPRIGQYPFNWFMESSSKNRLPQGRISMPP